MIKTLFDSPSDRTLNVLCLGAHCDDIEIGCGGTLLELRRQREKVNLKWVVFSSDAERQSESVAAASEILKSDVVTSFHSFRDGYFPAEYGELKKKFESLKTAFDPDVIFTHYQHDYHQDHRVISEITSSTFRSHLILEYEIPKYDGDLGNPSVFVPLTKETSMKKARIVVEANQSQREKHWFTEDTFLSLMRLRGVQCGAVDGYAEAFYNRKQCLSLKHI